ncbi:Ubiquitin-like-specific protease 1A [Apostasia shenzhenica]|uniref:Ubiquitin-like-specific protease 1A n=1 Tax=Apostasia shenzhenica TaxID=1088818 RepID=A0A2I0AAE4_9ASPA|nr:Ubiquitin-like-specific protease 1A [Apostasia shenzhenica]
MKSWKSKSLFYLKDISEASIAAADFLMAPIHNKSHWTLLVCELKSKNWIIYDSIPGQPHKGIVRQLIMALHKECIPFQKLNTKAWSLVSPDVLPRQSNNDDCGIFVIKYMKHLLNCSDSESEWMWRDYLHWQSEMNLFRAEIAYDLIKFGQKLV